MNPKNLEEKTILNGDHVLTVYHLGDGYYVPCEQVFKFEERKHKIFEDKMDAMYFKTVRRLQKGIPLSNYKKSKHYQYYLERLRKEHPEFVI